MAGNRIQIRRGSGMPPSGSLMAYELGWDYTNKILYIVNVENNAGIFRKIGGEGAFLPLSGGTMTGNITSPSTASTWVAGQNSANGAYNVGNATNTGSYWPWLRQTNTSSAKWFSFGTLNTSFYWIGSATSRTENGYDQGMNFDVATGKLLVGGAAVIRDSGTTSRRIFVTTSASVPSGAVAGDIVLVKV